MEASNSGLLSLLTSKMAYLRQQQAVEAENIANSSTVGYKARELKPFTFGDALKQASGPGMAVTNSRHILPASMAGVNAATVKVKDYATSTSGNSVDVEQEMMKVSKTGVEYQLMTGLYRKIQGLFRIALKGQ